MSGFANGIGTLAAFNQPLGIAVTASGSFVYIADRLNQRIRVLDVATKTSTQIDENPYEEISDLRWSATMDSWVDPDGECWDDGAWPDPKHVQATRLGVAPPNTKAGEVVGYNFIPG
jgi:hypothetical protein